MGPRAGGVAPSLTRSFHFLCVREQDGIQWIPCMWYSIWFRPYECSADDRSMVPRASVCRPIQPPGCARSCCPLSSLACCCCVSHARHRVLLAPCLGRTACPACRLQQRRLPWCLAKGTPRVVFGLQNGPSVDSGAGGIGSRSEYVVVPLPNEHPIFPRSRFAHPPPPPPLPKNAHTFPVIVGCFLGC